MSRPLKLQIVEQGRRRHLPITVPPRMDRQHGRQAGINTAALDMALASIRNQAISKVLTAVGIFAGKREQ
jgi:hypothetical protein